MPSACDLKSQSHLQVLHGPREAKVSLQTRSGKDDVSEAINVLLGVHGPHRQWQLQHVRHLLWASSKMRGTFLGVPIIRIIVDWSLDWGPPAHGNYNLHWMVDPVIS